MRRTPRLGQHFLTNRAYARRLAEAAARSVDETALEIGPGKGMLTEEILKTGARVVAVEKDPTLARHLREKFAESIAHGRLRIIEGDVRDFHPEHAGLNAGAYVVAANIPYYITGEILRQFLSTDAQPSRMALLVQQEVAERILAADGKESILSLSVKAYGNPRIVAKVSKGNFSPPPSVDSAILLIDDVSKRFFDGFSEAAFFSIVRAGFSSKRKFLAGNLSGLFPGAKEAMRTCAVDERARAEDLPLDSWRRLAARIISQEKAR